MVYLADGAHCPYGSRPAEEIQRYSLGIAHFLVECGASLIVVACNTASAAALEILRAEFDVPVVGMEPALKPAAQQTQTGHIGVLATRGTLNGNLFRNTMGRHANGVTVHVKIGEGLVELVEAGQTYTPETTALLRTYLQPMLDAGVDQIALGCTHYSFLMPVIRRLVPDGVSVIDPAAAVARRVEQVLMSESIEPDEKSVSMCSFVAPSCFFTTGRPATLAAGIRALTGSESKVESVTWNLDETRIGWDQIE
jgi:glutamate racemase